MALACVFMYSMAAAHCALNVYWIFVDNSKSIELQQQTVRCLLSTTPCTILSVSLQPSTNQCILTPLVLVNVGVYSYA